MRLPFLERSSPPPFYRPELSDEARTRLDKWFIGTRSQSYYLARFAKMDRAGRLVPSWNWSALVMTFAWLLYRKRFLDCFVYCVAGLSFVKLTIVVSLAIAEFVVIRHLGADIQVGARVLLGGSIWLFWAVQVARWADAYYYRMARREIADALELYPYDQEAQKAHLAHHGGVSLLGLVLAFGLYVGILCIGAFHVVPLWAVQKEEAVIYDSYHTLSHARARVEQMYKNTGHCPVGLQLSSDTQVANMRVVGVLDGVKSDCAVVLTIGQAGYPVRYLNGQTMAMYRKADGGWQCQSSFVRRKNPKGCL